MTIKLAKICWTYNYYNYALLKQPTLCKIGTVHQAKLYRWRRLQQFPSLPSNYQGKSRGSYFYQIIAQESHSRQGSPIVFYLCRVFGLLDKLWALVSRYSGRWKKTIYEAMPAIKKQVLEVSIVTCYAPNNWRWDGPIINYFRKSEQHITYLSRWWFSLVLYESYIEEDEIWTCQKNKDHHEVKFQNE